MSESKKIVYAATAANVAIAAAKFTVAAITGSSAILSEGIHSLVDSTNESLLLLGLRRSRKRADAQHPFGHGKELYFWSLIVAIVLFGVGAGMALYEGIHHLLHPQPMENAGWSYVVLAAAAVFEGISFAFAYRGLGAAKDEGRPWRWWLRIRRSKDPSIFTVFLEDLAALLGIGVAFLGVLLGQLSGSAYFDGAASVVIGLLLGAVALLLAHESRGLLVGESATREVVDRLHATLERDAGVRAASLPQTMQLSPESFLVNARLQFEPSLSVEQQLAALERITAAIKHEFPQASQISLQPVRHVRDGAGVS